MTPFAGLSLADGGNPLTRIACAGRSAPHPVGRHPPRQPPSAIPRHNERRHPADRPPSVDPPKPPPSASPNKRYSVRTSTTPIARTRATNTKSLHVKFPPSISFLYTYEQPIHAEKKQQPARPRPCAPLAYPSSLPPSTRQSPGLPAPPEKLTPAGPTRPRQGLVAIRAAPPRDMLLEPGQPLRDLTE